MDKTLFKFLQKENALNTCPLYGPEALYNGVR